MPVHEDIDEKGMYIQWGSHGKRYHYKNEKEKQKAYFKALKQMSAAFSNGYKQKK